jgi:two-component system OmpR family sensor kinase
LEQSPVDLVSLVERAITAARVASPDRAIELDAPESLITYGDEDRLRQVVDNLLSNATTHTPSGSPVRVAVTVITTTTPGVLIGTPTGGNPTAVLTVSDDGGGVDPEEASRIFEPFYRADPSRSRSSGGSGLGLAIAAAIVRVHGGEIGVDSTDGGGARFWVSLPVSPSD